ncbi:MAG: polyribonucleotide nucleotidyltransferase [Proteobacteria bacterium]|nr:polyribonucleotide nucleotidyltransferase [Pseudomonadota bacterium]
MNIVKKSIQFGDHTLTLETGEIARQATGAVIVSLDDTKILVTVVAERNPSVERDFFPLTVNYTERTYAAGKIPGGYLKREGRPSDPETLIARLIDRPLRPLFPKEFKNEVQIIGTVMSLDPQISADIPTMIGASAALAISGVPFMGPIGAARIGYKDGIYLLNPTRSQIEESALDLVVAGTEKAVLMVESEAKQLSEQVMLGAVVYGHEMMKPIIAFINDFAKEVGNASWDWKPAHTPDLTLENKVDSVAKSAIANAYLIQEKTTRVTELNKLRENTAQQITAEMGSEVDVEKVKALFNKIEKKTVRERILNGEPRIDGRDNKTVRPITIKTNFLPRAHGSAVFTRGETQAIVAATLGNERDAQMIDSVYGEMKERFMLHYNFPPFSVGEIGMVGSPKRREIGHGRLARRSLEAVLPSATDFPYVLRVVSEITESNGSSSMATVCGTSIALMDAGVPIKAPVAGIAMGLVKEGDKFAVLTDILGDEDHLGDMDFKVAGTQQGITALQMDIKIDGITQEIMGIALEQAKHGRQHILEVMGQYITKPKEEISEFAPRIVTIKIDSDKIRDVIGKGGATIRSITEETGVSIDISDDGTVKIFSADQAASEKAINIIKNLTAQVEIGQIYEGKISRIVDFGAFVTLPGGKDGLLHISQISEERVERVTDVLQEGQLIKVKVLDVDRQGKIKLSKRAIETAEQS